METTAIVEISDLVMALPGKPGTCRVDRLVIMPGDMIAMDASEPMNCRKLLRMLATLEPPQKGHYRFNGQGVDLSNYRQCLSVKRQIGYIAADAAMISNRTIRENLLLTRYYYENDLALAIDASIADLCERAGLLDHLNKRPAEVDEAALKRFIAIREMGKEPLLVLIDRPEDFMGSDPEDAIFAYLIAMVQSGAAVVFSSLSHAIIELAGKRLTATNDTIGITDINTKKKSSR